MTASKVNIDSMKRTAIYKHDPLHFPMRMASRPVYTCDFDAILRTKPAPAYPARVFSRVTLRQNTAKLAEIGKKGVLK